MAPAAAGVASTDTPASHRLGLALSGGGFRATLFHLGVLRRLAELDLLRELSVISSVSGGSILAAHYLLLLRRALNARGRASAADEARSGGGLRLEREEYVQLVQELREAVRAGIRRNPRVRLFANPWINLQMLLGGRALGWRMATLYEREFLCGAGEGSRALRLHELRVERVREIDQHNSPGQRARGNDRVPKLILNATSLNSGAPFMLSAAEVGDPRLGYIRFDEVDRILFLKDLLGEATPARRRPARQLRRDDDPALDVVHRIAAGRYEAAERRPGRDERRRTFESQESVGFRAEPRVLEKASAWSFAWWLAVRAARDVLDDTAGSDERARAAFESRLHALTEALAGPASADPRLAALAGWDIARAVLEAPPGVLRDAKIPAWYLTRGAKLALTRARDEERTTRLAELTQALSRVHPALGALASADDAAVRGLARFVVDVYQLRSAELVSASAQVALATLTVPDAVAASANFPPVFPPYVIRDLYDPDRVASLGLSDGGVYDNQGTTALLAEGCTDVIVSDAGGLLAPEPVPPPGRMAMSARLVEVLQDAVRDLELRRVHEGVAEGRRRAAVFHISSPPQHATPPGAADPLDPVLARCASALRTDLDAFEPDEMDALEYQGYQLADRFVRREMVGDARPPPWRRPPPVSRRILEAGRYRFFRWFFRMALPGRLAALGLMAASAIALVALHLVPSVGRILHGVEAALGWEVHALTGSSPGPLLAATWSWVVLGGVVLVIATRRFLPGWARPWLRKALRWLWMLVLLAPVVVAVTACALSWAALATSALRRRLQRWGAAGKGTPGRSPSGERRAPARAPALGRTS